MALVELRKQIPGLERIFPQYDDTVHAVVQAASQISKNTIGEHLDEFPVLLTDTLCWGRDSLAPREYFLELNEERKASQGATWRSWFAVLRGLNPNDYGDEDNVIVYAGLLSHIGNKRCKNAFGMSLEHTRCLSLPKPERLERDVELDPAKKHYGMSFHTDRFFADILAFYVLGKATEGGDQQFSTLKEITNDIIWPPRLDSLPIIEQMVLHAKGKVISQIIWAPSLGNQDYLTSSLKRALGAVNRSAPANCITVNSQPGDIQLLNNFAVMHSRNGFRDSDSERRYLM